MQKYYMDIMKIMERSNKMEEQRNKKVILVLGPPATGKTFCLKNLINNHGSEIVYINTDGKTNLPFKGKNKINKFITPKDPLEINPGVRAMEAMDDINYVIVDTLSFWLDSIEQKHVIHSPDSRGAWGSIYAAEAKNLLHFANNVSNKTWIFLSHTQEGEVANYITPTKAYAKGAVGRLGVEAYFDTVIYTNVFEDDNSSDGVGYRFQVKKTKETIGLSVRSPEDMFPGPFTETNDIMKILEAIDAYEE